MSTGELALVLSSGGQFYAVLGTHRECGIWLSLQKHPLPVPSEWHRPGDTFAAVMRGRDYYRIGASAPQHSNSTKSITADDELVKDYFDAAWWTPGLQEAWAENTRRSVAEPSAPVEHSETSKRVREVRSEGVCDVRTAREARDSKKDKSRG